MSVSSFAHATPTYGAETPRDKRAPQVKARFAREMSTSKQKKHVVDLDEIKKGVAEVEDNVKRRYTSEERDEIEHTDELLAKKIRMWEEYSEHAPSNEQVRAIQDSIAHRQDARRRLMKAIRIVKATERKIKATGDEHAITSRADSDTSAAFIVGKPPFHSFGKGNLRPVCGGLVYQNYMVSHNAASEMPPNVPSRRQVYPNVRRTLRQRVRIDNEDQPYVEAALQKMGLRQKSSGSARHTTTGKAKTKKTSAAKAHRQEQRHTKVDGVCQCPCHASSATSSLSSSSTASVAAVPCTSAASSLCSSSSCAASSSSSSSSNASSFHPHKLAQTSSSHTSHISAASLAAVVPSSSPFSFSTSSEEVDVVSDVRPVSNFSVAWSQSPVNRHLDLSSRDIGAFGDKDARAANSVKPAGLSSHSSAFGRLRSKEAFVPAPHNIHMDAVRRPVSASSSSSHRSASSHHTSSTHVQCKTTRGA